MAGSRTRNYIGIITSVNCSATVAKLIARQFENRLDDFPNVDGVVALTHKTGCGMASEGEAIDILRRTIAGYIRHANFHSVLLVGLGCESNQINHLLAAQGLKRTDHLHAYTIQDKGGTRKAVEEGVARIKALLPEANKVARETVPASHLTLGLQCGGSDGYSGISANPALGAAVDLLVRHGGTAILSETPEIYGAEHLLTRRAVSREVGEKLIRRIRWWEEHTARMGNEMNNNPSPGNKAGGLTTILEKSLGAVAKGGTTNLVDVYEYAEPVTAKGFVFMDTPGYDPVSATGQVAGGANMICFTTGRGSAYGCKPSPSLKLATNTPLFVKQEDDMDINCGTIVDGKESIEEVGAQFFELILKTASGRSRRASCGATATTSSRRGRSAPRCSVRGAFVTWRATMGACAGAPDPRPAPRSAACRRGADHRSTAGAADRPPAPTVVVPGYAIPLTEYHGAIAYNRATGAYGYSFDYPTPRDAGIAAINGCGETQCIVAIAFKSGCAVLVDGPGGPVVAEGVNALEAEVKARGRCTDPQCQVVAWACTR